MNYLDEWQAIIIIALWPSPMETHEWLMNGTGVNSMSVSSSRSDGIWLKGILISLIF